MIQKILHYSIVLISLVIFSQNCASLMPREQRKVEFIQESKLKKKEIFERSLIYVSKTFSATSLPNPIRDEANGRIITFLRLDCDGLGYINYPLNTTVLESNLDLTIKDNKFRIIFDDIHMKSYNPYGRVVYSPHPSNDVELKKMIDKCIAPLKDELIKNLEGRGITLDKEF
jgi:hypothetical protein